ncbi:MAG: IS4 family transposase [Ruthenibacterium sp.]
MRADEYKSILCNAIGEVTSMRGNFSTDVRGFTRERKLSCETVMRLLLSMDGGSLARELHKAGIEVTPSAFVQQRHKIASSAFGDVLSRFNGACSDNELYRGYRLLAVDGATVNLPYNPKAASFLSVPGNPKGGYNALHLNPFYDILNKTYFDCIVQPQPKADEIGALNTLLYRNRFATKTLIIADRGYESYNTIAHLYNTPNIDFLIRVKQDRSSMREIGKLPMIELDKSVAFVITTTQTNADKAENRIFLQTGSKKGKANSTGTRITRWDFPSPYMMAFRVIRFMLDSGEYETLITSLDRSFSMDELKKLYHMRWGIETSFRQLKYCVGLTNLHGKSDEFAAQELYAALTMYNFCNRISREAVIEQKRERVYEYRVNLTMAIYLCKEYFRTQNADGEKLLCDIAKYTEPVRPGRQDARNLKTKSFVGFTYRVAA